MFLCNFIHDFISITTPGHLLLLASNIPLQVTALVQYFNSFVHVQVISNTRFFEAPDSSNQTLHSF